MTTLKKINPDLLTTSNHSIDIGYLCPSCGEKPGRDVAEKTLIFSFSPGFSLLNRCGSVRIGESCGLRSSQLET